MEEGEDGDGSEKDEKDDGEDDEDTLTLADVTSRLLRCNLHLHTHTRGVVAANDNHRCNLLVDELMVVSYDLLQLHPRPHPKLLLLSTQLQREVRRRKLCSALTSCEC